MSDTLYTSWQVECLQGMGLHLFAFHDDVREQEPIPAEESQGIAPAPAPSPMPSQPAPAKSPSRPPMIPPPMGDIAASASSTRASTARALPPSSQLERDLLAATGQSRRAEARAVLDKLAVNSAVLQGNPAAKRALWLQLRKLRPKRR